MLHTLTDSGHMAWTCPCGSERMAHISHPEVTHPSYAEQETIPDGTHTDEQGRTWTRHITRPTGNTITHADVIALPPCECGTRTFLKATFDDEEYAGIARHDSDGNETNASVEAAHRHMALAQQLKNAGKGPQEKG